MSERLIPAFVAFSLLFAVFFLPALHPWSEAFQLVFLTLGLFLFLYDGINKGELDTKRGALPSPLALFLVLAVLYTWRSADYTLSRDFLFVLYSYLAIYLLVAHLQERGRRYVLAFLVVLGTFCALHGIYQFFFGFESLLQKIRAPNFRPPPGMAPFMAEVASRIEQKRVFSTFLLPSHFAAFLGMTIPLTTGAFFTVRRITLAFLLLIAASLQILALFLTRSFSGWLSFLLAGTFVFSICMVIRERVSVRRLAGIWVMALTAIGLIFFLLTLLRPDNPFSAKNNPLLLRLLNWKVALRMIWESPFWGRGLATFGLFYPQYQEAGGNVVHHAHNSYLQLGTEMGVLGAGAFIWFALWWVRGMVQALRRDGGQNVPLIMAVLVAGVAFFIHTALDFAFYEPGCGLVAFAILGLGVPYMRRGERLLRVKEGWRSPLALGGLAVSLALCIIFILPFYGRLYYQRAELKLQGRVTIPASGVSDLYRAIRFDPRSSEYHHALGVALFRHLGREEEGIAEVKKAISLSPLHHHYHFDLGMMYLMRGEREKGEGAIRRAQKLCPFCEDYRKVLQRLQGR